MSNTNGTQALFALIERLAGLGYRLGLLITVGYLMYYGWQYVQSGGRVDQIHKNIGLAILGLALMIASFSIPVLLRSFITQ